MLAKAVSEERYREGHEFFVCAECGDHMVIDQEFRAEYFNDDVHEGIEGSFWGATCDTCEADLSPFVFNPHYDPLVVGVRVRDTHKTRGCGVIMFRWNDGDRELLRVRWDSAPMGLPRTSVRELGEVKLEKV